mmetsp:Transcript_26424/g.36849  ORF Transcript_26424/g.36849 Transcript_26424/m.36849 type:complete len:899 (-) Transcript_26424:143-2839(-)
MFCCCSANSRTPRKKNIEEAESSVWHEAGIKARKHTNANPVEPREEAKRLESGVERQGRSIESDAELNIWLEVRLKREAKNATSFKPRKETKGIGFGAEGEVRGKGNDEKGDEEDTNSACISKGTSSGAIHEKLGGESKEIELNRICERDMQAIKESLLVESSITPQEAADMYRRMFSEAAAAKVNRQRVREANGSRRITESDVCNAKDMGDDAAGPKTVDMYHGIVPNARASNAEGSFCETKEIKRNVLVEGDVSPQEAADMYHRMAAEAAAANMCRQRAIDSANDCAAQETTTVPKKNKSARLVGNCISRGNCILSTCSNTQSCSNRTDEEVKNINRTGDADLTYDSELQHIENDVRVEMDVAQFEKIMETEYTSDDHHPRRVTDTIAPQNIAKNTFQPRIFTFEEVEDLPTEEESVPSSKARSNTGSRKLPVSSTFPGSQNSPPEHGMSVPAKSKTFYDPYESNCDTKGRLHEDPSTDSKLYERPPLSKSDGRIKSVRDLILEFEGPAEDERQLKGGANLKERHPASLEVSENVSSDQEISKTIDLSKKSLHVIPENVFEMQHLEQLFAEENEIIYLPTDLGRLENLRELGLHENSLICIPSEIGKLRKLKSLSLAVNRIGKVPPAIGDLGALEQLWLQMNLILSLPPEIGKLSKLRVLDISQNSIVSLPDEIGNLVDLQKFSLHRNKIRSLPKSIGKLRHLRHLIAHKNKLTDLPPEIGGLESLNVLNLAKNELATLPEEIALLSNLQKLTLYQNFLKTIPIGIAKLEGLIELGLHENLIETIDFDFSKLVHLEILQLQANRISSISSLSKGLNALEVLDLSWNRLSQPPPALVEIKTLRKLNLQGNSIQEMPNLSPLKSLDVLRLDMNRLNEHPSGIGHVRHVRLGGNMFLEQ